MKYFVKLYYVHSGLQSKTGMSSQHQQPVGKWTVSINLCRMLWTSTFLLRLLQFISVTSPGLPPEIKSFIVKRQRAFNNGKISLWKLLRNKIIRLLKVARSAFYSISVAKLSISNPRQWHQQIRIIAGFK